MPIRHDRGCIVSVETAFKAVGRVLWGRGVDRGDKRPVPVTELKAFEMEEETERYQQHL